MKTSLLFSCILLLSGYTAGAQTFTLSGKVKNAQQEPVPGAYLMLLLDTTLLLTALTDMEGIFTLEQVATGDYNIAASLTGINKGIITELIQPSETEDSVTVHTSKNLDRMIFAGLSGCYPFQVTKWWSNMTSFNVYYAIYQGNIANTPLDKGRPTSG